MAEYLDLREDCLAAPTRWDLAVIEARMLWPHDPEIRGRFLSAVSVKVGVSSIGRVPLEEPTPPTPDEVREFGEAMLSAPRVEDFTAAGERAYHHGMVAGGILVEVVGASAVGRENVGLAGIKSMLAARLSRWGRLSQKTIDNSVWPRYRSVAHFWAAHILISKETDSSALPCRLRDLDLFLATADACRLRGEGIRSAPQATTPVLRQGEAVLIPPALALPEIELSFSTE